MIVLGKNKASVRIAGKEYILVGEEPEQYIYNLAYYVDKKISEMLKINPMLSTSMASVLTALNVADEYLKLAEKETKMLDEKAQVLEQVKEANHTIQLIKNEVTLAKKETEFVLKEKADLLDVIRRKDAELEEYKTTLERSAKVRFYTKGS